MGGAMYLEDFRRLMAKCGFNALYFVEKTPIQPHDFEVARLVGDIQFYSCTVRAFKCSDLEDREENYGQSAIYLGTMPENKRYMDFDENLRFVKNRPVGISGNVASILQASRFSKYFEVKGDYSEHYGLYTDMDRDTNTESLDYGKPITLRDLENEAERYDIPNILEQVNGISELTSKPELTTMQVNVGYRCNLACTHCFLECGPKRQEAMTKETMNQCLKVFRDNHFKVMDITGGSPEMNPNLPYLIEEASKLGQVIIRTNLVILKDEKYAPLLDVYAKNKVKIVCSLPYYKKNVVEKQRGKHVFDPAIEMLQKLNAMGYGIQEDLHLTLVYNTDGPYLPPNEFMLEDTYREVLRRDYGIEFTDLIAIGNVPLGRFGQELRQHGKLGSYLRMQSDNFNQDNLPGVMCRDQINVDYDGSLYDCEYYHVLGIHPEGCQHISELSDGHITPREIKTCSLCYSCTAGYGSSCGGNLSH